MSDTSRTRLELDETTRALTGRLWRNYLRDYRGRLAVAVVFMFVVSAATGLQVHLVQPAFDNLLIAGDSFWLWAAPLGFLVCAVVGGSSNFVQSYLMHQIGLRIVQRTQEQMFSAILRMDLADLQRQGTGRQLSRFTTDVQFLRDAVIKAFTGIGRDVLKVAVLGGVMFYHNWQMALLAAVFFPLSVWPIVRLGRRIRKVSTNTQLQSGQMTAILDDVLKGARQVKAYNMYDHEQGRANGTFEQIYQLVLKAARTRALNYPILDTLGGFSIALVLLWGGLQVQAGTTTVGSFMSFFAAVLMAYQPMRGLANMNATLQEGLAAAKRIFDVIDYEPSIRDRPDAKPLEISGGEVAFAGVSFSYEPGEAVLHDVDLTVPQGRTVALVGPSGAGKSTVLNAIPRFYDVESGTIAIDGQDVRSVTLESLRGSIGLVTQETALFNDTIRANIAYGRPDASEEEIAAAARDAAAHEFIEALPAGYDTVVGEHGLKLSGGQRQRLSIARAMLKNAPILLLDEATSALDTESERQVQLALSRLMKGRTTLVIAHRLSTVADADLIYVMDRGRVVEQGTHAVLSSREGLYARLCRMQFQPDASEPPSESPEAPAADEERAERRRA